MGGDPFCCVGSFVLGGLSLFCCLEALRRATLILFRSVSFFKKICVVCENIYTEHISFCYFAFASVERTCGL
jgi:hypothetical protein